jgi:hypothetical protein
VSYVKYDFEVGVLFDSEAEDINTGEDGAYSEEAAERRTEEIAELQELIQMALQPFTIAHPTIDGISVKFIEL